MQIEGCDPQTEAAAEATERFINGIPTTNENSNEENNNHQIIMIMKIATMDTDRVELLRLLAEYHSSSNPTKRLKLLKLRANKTTIDKIEAFNIDLRDFIEDHNTLQNLHARIYCVAVLVLRCHSLLL